MNELDVGWSFDNLDKLLQAWALRCLGRGAKIVLYNILYLCFIDTGNVYHRLGFIFIFAYTYVLLRTHCGSYCTRHKGVVLI